MRYRLSFYVHEFLRGAVRLRILHHADRGAIHSAGMSEEFARHGNKISLGVLYPTLSKMQEEGQLRSRTELVASRSRRSYVAITKGRRDLEATIEQLCELAHEVLDNDPT